MESKKLEYLEAEMEIVAFESEDVITTSGGSGCDAYDSEESCVGDI